MVVDDDDEVRGALGDVLEEVGYRVVAARNGSQALEKLRAGVRPRALLLDLWMPEMDGWQLRHTLLCDAELREIPVIVLTAAPNQRAEALDVACVLTKPLELERLLHTLSRTVQTSS
jgi:CheY-like chemotaxis protein